MVCIIPVKFPCPHPSIAMSPNNFAVRWGSSGGSGGRARWVWPVVLAGGERWKKMEIFQEWYISIVEKYGKRWKRWKILGTCGKIWKNMGRDGKYGNRGIFQWWFKIWFNGNKMENIRQVMEKIEGKNLRNIWGKWCGSCVFVGTVCVSKDAGKPVWKTTCWICKPSEW